ncbi:MAG: ABC transporter permease [Nitrososphaeria archaeon]
MLEPLKHAYYVMKKDLTEFYRVRARLVSMILFPIILMLLFGYMFPSNGAINHVPIAVVVQGGSPQTQGLVGSFTYAATSSKMFNVITYASLSKAEMDLVQNKVYAIVIFRSEAGAASPQVEVILDQLSPTLDQLIKGELTEIFSQIGAQAAVSQGFQPSPGTISVHFKGLVPIAPSSFEFLAPGFIVVSTVMGGLAGLAMTFSRERELGTMDGLLMTPVSRFSIVFGKAMAQAVRGIVSGVIIVILSIILFGVTIYGNVLIMSLVIVLGILSFTGLGIIATSFVSDQESAQLIMMIIQMPMIFISGVFYPVIQLPWWLRDIAYMMPLVYTVTAFRAEMVLNAPLLTLMPSITALIIYSVVTMSIAIPLFQRMSTR